MKSRSMMVGACVAAVAFGHIAVAQDAVSVAQDAVSEVAVAPAPRGQARLKITAESAVPPAPDVPVAERRHHINVHVKRSDDDAVITGPVTIKGVPMVASADVGDVDWQVSGSKVSGTVRHAANVATTFEGTLTAEGASGTFTLPNGARGEWSWDGPLPK